MFQKRGGNNGGIQRAVELGATMDYRFSVRLWTLCSMLALTIAARPLSAGDHEQLVLKVEQVSVISSSDVLETGISLSVGLRSEAANDLHAFTASYVGNLIECVIDGQVRGKFVIREPVKNTRLQLPFEGSILEATQAAERLSSGRSTLLLRLPPLLLRFPPSEWSLRR